MMDIFKVYWILDVVAEHLEPLTSLIPPADEDKWYFAVMFNKEPLGLSPQETVELVSLLFERDLLRVWSLTDPFEPVGPGTSLTSERIVQAFAKPYKKEDADSKDKLWYGLSLHGGDVWQGLCASDWFELITVEIRPIKEQGRKRISRSNPAASHNRSSDGLKKIISSASRTHLERIFLEDQQVHRIVVPNSEQWSEVTPYFPFYWKRIEKAYQLSYRLLSEEESSATNPLSVTDARLIAGKEQIGSWRRDFITGLPVR